MGQNNQQGGAQSMNSVSKGDIVPEIKLPNGEYLLARRGTRQVVANPKVLAFERNGTISLKFQDPPTLAIEIRGDVGDPRVGHEEFADDPDLKQIVESLKVLDPSAQTESAS